MTGPWDAEPRPAADPALVAAYPGERQRADAARWLGWLASRLAERGRLEWWLIPRYLQDGTGSCAGCYGPDDTGSHGGHPGVPDDDPPDIHIFDP